MPEVNMAAAQIPIVTFKGKKLTNWGEWVRPKTINHPSPAPSRPPASESATASLTNSPSTPRLVNPKVFSTATSRVRSRIDIAMVLADTSKVANTTAEQMLRMNAFTLPIMATNSSPNAFSLSALVGCGELRNMSSTVPAILLTSPGVAARMVNVPAWPLKKATASSTYFALKYTDLLSGFAWKMPRMINSRFTG